MTYSAEKRSYKRCKYETSIKLTCFNSGSGVKAQTLNHCTDGMCVVSNSYLKPGTTVIVKVINFAPNDSCACTFDGLPTITFGEVKWCRGKSDINLPSYEIGLKYYAPGY